MVVGNGRKKFHGFRPAHHIARNRSMTELARGKGSTVVVHSDRGFALVITLTLLALLVLAVIALTALARVNSKIAGTSLQQAVARQNALLALDVGVGKLQLHAGPDNRLTGMAGVSGAPLQSTFRQWAGVWNSTPSPVWLVSGGNSSATPSLTGSRLTIVGSHSVGSPADTTDQEPVEVGLIDLPGIDGPGLVSKTGRMGYWVGDEGVKVSAVVSDEELQIGGTSGRGIRPNFRTLISSAYDPASSLNSRVVSLEQLKVRVGGFSRSGSFHSLTRSHWALRGPAIHGPPRPGQYVVGVFNINTSSEAAWRALLEFPDSTDPAFASMGSRALSVARQIRDKITARGRPFGSVDELINSNIIQNSFDAASPKVTAITQADFFNELLPILTTRSDTFRIRAHGDVLDGADRATVQASAYCEAIVQRTPDLAPDSLGQQFILIYFRWLGRNDI
jgi:Tfp pilus assembly protein PilX